jgi:predicted TIM-barrel fold metal-dependent hydrolase
MQFVPTTFDAIRPGCFRVEERLDDMDENGVEASLCFPNYPRFAGQRFSEVDDKELGLACIRAYNDWMVDEWSGESGGRLIPLCLVPLWDSEVAAAEVRRNAARGVRAVCFTELPQWLGLPSLGGGTWDPFFAACDETETVVAMHIGSGTKVFSQDLEISHTAGLTLMFVNSLTSMAEMISIDLLDRFPRLKLLYAESQIGWIPYLLDRLDDTWRTTRYWGASSLERPPSSRYAGRVYSCLFKDHVGNRLLDLIGEDQVLFETDYPHTDGTWPNSIKAAEEQVGELPEETQHKILRRNAIQLLGLPFDR